MNCRSHAFPLPSSGQRGSPAVLPRGSSSSASTGRRMSRMFFSVLSIRAARSSSCHGVMMSTTFAPAARRDLRELSHSSHTCSLRSGESASLRFLMGSSIKSSSAGLPVIPASNPREISRPNSPPFPRSSNSLLRLTPSSVTPNSRSPKSRSFSRLRRANRSADSSL